jgi:hypothetical protein
MKTLPFHIIQHVLPLERIKSKKKILYDILENHLYGMSKIYIQDIIEAIFTPNDIKMGVVEYIKNKNILYILTVIIRKNIERKIKVKQDAVFVLFYEVVKYVNSFISEPEFTNDIMLNIWSILIHIIDQNILDQINIYIVADLMFMHFTPFRLCIQDGFKKKIIKRDSPDVFDMNNWRLNRKALFESIEKTKNYIKDILIKYDRPICHIDKNMYAFILQLSIDDSRLIMNKVSPNAIIDVMTSISIHPSTNYVFELVVDPMHMINTAISCNMNLSMTIRNFVEFHRKPYIIYENENGKIGIDAGGLTRDFYSQYLLQLRDHMIEKEGYMTFTTGLNGFNSIQRARFAGVITAYAIFRENISPSIRFHPIISYFIIMGSTIEIRDIICFLEKYDIEYVKNMGKILELDENEYIKYLDMQGENINVSKKDHLKNLLYDRYITPTFIAFIRGFRDIFTQIDIYSFIKPHILYDFMVGIEFYNIIGESSLESVLKVECGDNTSMTNKRKEYLKQTFLEVLENINRTDISKLKALFRFWYGSHSIRYFQDVDLTLRVLYCSNDLHGCFSSSTCFGKLYIHSSQIDTNNTKADLKNCLIGHIDKTLENQRLVESVGMYMQMD